MRHLKTYESFNSDNFKQWFGSSKMVDKNGQPKVFYHGVGRAGKFDTFNKDLISASSGNHGHFGVGFYFTDEEKGAKGFSDFFGGTGEVMSVYLKMENPFYVNEENLIELGEKYELNLPSKVDMGIDINDLLDKLKGIDVVAHELLSLISKHDDYEKGWKEFLSNHNDEIPESKLDLNTVSDWYEDTIIEKYGNGVSEYTIEELKNIGIEPKIIRGYDEHIRMEYLTDLGQSATAWTDAIKKEGYDGIVAGDEFVIFEPNQIKSVDNKGSFSKNSDNINESNEDILSPKEILDYINDLHEFGYDEKEYEDWEWINKFDVYRLEDVKLSNLKISAMHPPLVKKYSLLETDTPPIVIDSESMFILDGNHRAKACEIRGDEYIKAYVGYKNIIENYESKGRKMVVGYNGTPNGGFSTFSYDFRSGGTDIHRVGGYGRGFYFTPHRDTVLSLTEDSNSMKYLKLFERFGDDGILDELSEKELEDRFNSKVVSEIKDNCSKYLNDLLDIKKTTHDGDIDETLILYRGYKRVYRHDDFVKLPSRKDRNPLDSNELIHDITGELSDEIHGWNMRSEGTFCSAKRDNIAIYGRVYMFLPIGDYEYLYHENISDYTRFMNLHVNIHTDIDSGKKKSREEIKNNLRETISRYESEDLKKAMISSSEISIKCDGYYLVNTKYINAFVKYINNRK